MTKYALTFVGAFTVFTLLVFGGIKLDLLLNSWLYNVVEQWHWWNYFTSSHALTVFYLKGSWLWLLPSFILSLLATCVIYLHVTYKD